MDGKPPCNRPLSLPTHDNLTVREVATFLRVSERVIYQHVAAQDLPHVKVGKLIRVKRAEFLSWYRGTY